MNIKIRAKIVIIAVIILFLAVGITTFVSIRVFTKDYSEALKSKFVFVAQILKSQLDHLLDLGIPLEELVGFEEQCSDTVNRYNTSYAMVTDAAGRILFHNSPSNRYNTIADRKIIDAIRSQKEVVQVYVEKGKRYYDIIRPVFNNNNVHVGAVRIGFPIRIIAEKTKQIVIYSATVALISFVLAVILLFLILSLWVTDPLKKLVNAIAEIRRKGTETAREVKIYSKDEVGDLASAFNLMVKDLKETTVSRDELLKEIAERKKAEEALKNAYEQLKRTQAQLVQSAKMASVGLLAGGVAHEINNPLTGILNNVQLIRMSAEQKKDFNLDDFKELLGVIEESAQRCTQITRSLLGFSRASKGVLQSLSLNEMVEKVVSLIGHELELENITVQTDLTPDLPLVKGDPQLLQQVIFDIITNARWAIQKKPKDNTNSITLKTCYESENNFVCLYISDTGIGISKEDLEHMFEPFFTTKPVGEGTGLGLAVVYNIIKGHNGTITLESQVAKGTTFKISLLVSPQEV